ncbi:ABC transporter ATP-binding protein [uncultured Winogradskyella sp.]|uniref:ABC transporter ATP-binding protein n=1 Tax=Winogradskyella sp. 4-2091 TaxID=3381659 RepID=UPI00263742AD|nr:ABC transporter ATP-binding protein [uncultured Winogradskyella sp.]
MSIILKAENISKQYRLGVVGTGTISHDINRWWAGIRGKEDPYLKVGSENDRSTKADSDYVWALQDINFEVRKGEVLGIIGKNGAGKSTLLKILSKVTIPTTGVIKTKGRIASLLEVGTGFHPELTGRENIYLNGAILGMTKAEIRTKEAEIIEFSGCERYVDTPVKRYSSGMRVRLAFAVAAFLEPDILVIDEVLAVGDAEFQKKAIGKMQDISKGDGRTVLFVSHNMGVIQSLCDETILLHNGRFVEKGKTEHVINTYLKQNIGNDAVFNFDIPKNNNIQAYATKLTIVDLNGNLMSEIPIGKPWKVKIHFTVCQEINNLIIGLGMTDMLNAPIRTSWTPSNNLTPGEYIAEFVEDSVVFNHGRYKLKIGISKGFHSIQYLDENVYITISEVVYKQDKTVLTNGNGVFSNQMKMNVYKT